MTWHRVPRNDVIPPRDPARTPVVPKPWRRPPRFKAAFHKQFRKFRSPLESRVIVDARSRCRRFFLKTINPSVGSPYHSVTRLLWILVHSSGHTLRDSGRSVLPRSTYPSKYPAIATVDKLTRPKFVSRLFRIVDIRSSWHTSSFRNLLGHE